MVRSVHHRVRILGSLLVYGALAIGCGQGAPTGPLDAASNNDLSALVAGDAAPPMDLTTATNFDMPWQCTANSSCDAKVEYCYRFLAGISLSPPSFGAGPVQGCNRFLVACGEKKDCTCALMSFRGMAGCDCKADGARITVTCVAP